MADSIVRLRVESQEFEQKLKRASQELLAMADNARRTGATFAIADKEELAFVASLGQLQTSARSAKGTIAEMTKAFQDLSVHYRSLTAEEKAAPYGRELKKSLEELRQRINDGKASLNEINSSIGESKQQTTSLSTAVNDLTGKLGLNIPKLSTMGMAIGAVTTALKVAKDAFFASEANIDEWGRTVDASKAVYEGFLTSLNTGDISGFLKRIDQIISAAREAYDELDRLGTQRTIDSPRLNAQRAENERFRAMLRTGRYIAPNDGRTPTMKEGQVLTQTQLENISRMLENGMKNVNNITKSEIQQIHTSIEALYKKEAANLGMSIAEFKKGTSSMSALDERIAGYNNYVKTQRDIDMAKRSVAIANAEGLTVDKRTYNKSLQSNPYERYKAWGVFKDDGETMTKITDLISQMYNLQTQVTNTTAQGYRNINRVEGITVGGGRRGGGSVGGGSAVNFEVPAFQVDYKFDGGLLPEQEKENLSKAITKGMADFMVQAFQKTDPDTLKRLMQGESKGGIFDGADMSKGQQQAKKGGDQTMNKIAKGVGAIGQITGSLQNLGLKLPDGVTKAVSVMQSLISIIQAVQTVITVFSTGTQTANTVAVAANTAAVGALATVMTINTASKFIPFFSHGGIARAANGFIGGNSYSGDFLPVAVNSGELILNRAQQGNLASQLSGGAMGAIEVFGRVSGEDLEIVSRRRNRRRYGVETTNNRG